MKTNYPVDKSVLNFIHARDFFTEEVANNFASVAKGLVEKYQPMEYGLEIPMFNMTYPEMDMLMGAMLGDYMKIVEEKSGTFRIPYDNLIHFEFFNSLHEWRLAIALEDNNFRTYRHITARDARIAYELDYHNPDDWKVETQINLAAGDAVLYRPWVFHSFEAKPIHCYTILVQE